MTRSAGTEAIQYLFDFQEFFFVVIVIAARNRTVGAGFQLLTEMTNFIIQGLYALDFNVVTFVVINVIERLIDFFDSFFDNVPIAQQFGLENRHILDGIFPEPFLEFRKQLRQVIFFDTPVEFLVFIAVGPIEFIGQVRIPFIVHRQILHVFRHARGHNGTLFVFSMATCFLLVIDPAGVHAILFLHGF